MIVYQVAFYIVMLLLLALAAVLTTTTMIFWHFNDWDKKSRQFTLWNFQCYTIIGRPPLEHAVYGKYFCFRIVLLGTGWGFDILLKQVEEPTAPKPQENATKDETAQRSDT